MNRLTHRAKTFFLCIAALFIVGQSVHALDDRFAGTFAIEATGELDRSGRIIPETLKYTRTEGDERTVAAVKEAISTADQNGIFQYAKQMGASTFTIRLQQDANDFNGSYSTDTQGYLRAKSTQAALSMMLKMAPMQIEQSGTSADKAAELALLKNTTVSSEGSNVIVSLRMPKTEFWAIAGPKLPKAATAK